MPEKLRVFSGNSNPELAQEMYYSGYCKDRDRIKWRCPTKAVKKNQNLKCDFIDVCSPSDYGRVI
jgi:hypothetical protein